MTKIHLDTDIGGDMDDLCALAMLLKWPDLEITGVTTVSEDQGRRAGYVHYVLSLVGRTGIPCVAGADVSGEILRCAQDDTRRRRKLARTHDEEARFARQGGSTP